MSRRFLPPLEKKQPGPPPQDAHSKRIFSNRLQGQTAWQRHQEYVARYLRVYERDGGKARLEALAAGNRNDWDVLRERHRFLRHDDEVPSSSEGGSSYEDEVARRYYSHLFKEYAVADLKHYKSGAIALRWRSEEDVIEGIGQFSECVCVCVCVLEQARADGCKLSVRQYPLQGSPTPSNDAPEK